MCTRSCRDENEDINSFTHEPLWVLTHTTWVTRDLCWTDAPVSHYRRPLKIRDFVTGTRGDVFVVRTSKPVENLWKNGLFWSCYSFVTHSIDRKPWDWGLARSAYSIKYGVKVGPPVISTLENNAFSYLHYGIKVTLHYLMLLGFEINCFGTFAHGNKNSCRTIQGLSCS